MKNQMFLLFFLVVLLSSGCATKTPSPYITEHPEVTEDGSPYWTVLTPLSSDRFYGVGMGNLSSKLNSKKRAEALARNEIAEQVSSMVRGAVQNYFTDSGLPQNEQNLSAFENFSIQVTHVTLRNVIIENNWTDPQTGEFWVIASYDKDNLEEAYRLEAESLKATYERQKIQAAKDIALIQKNTEETKAQLLAFAKSQDESDAQTQNKLRILNNSYQKILQEKMNELADAQAKLDAVDVDKLLVGYQEEQIKNTN